VLFGPGTRGNVTGCGVDNRIERASHTQVVVSINGHVEHARNFTGESIGDGCPARPVPVPDQHAPVKALAGDAYPVGLPSTSFMRSGPWSASPPEAAQRMVAWRGATG
jgi:hypothetical protein